MKPPRHQYTLAELMGLVALCAVAMALLMSPAAPIGAAVLVVIPGFILERVRGGTGILGGTISGCLIPTVLLAAWGLFEHVSTGRPSSELLDLFPTLYLFFVLCLILSFVVTTLIFLLDRGLQGRRSRPRAVRVDATGIWFLPDEDRPGSRGGESPAPVIRPGAAKGRPGG